MAEVIMLNSVLRRYEGLDQIVEIKEYRSNKLRPAFKSINGEVIYDFRKNSINNNKDSLNQTKGLAKPQIQELVKEIEVKEFQGTINGILSKVSAFAKNKKVRKIILKLVVLALVLALTLHGSAIAGTVTGALGSVIENVTTHPIINLPEKAVACFAGETTITAAVVETKDTYDFVEYIIKLMRGLIGIACGLIIANTALKIVTDENADGHREAKKSFQKIFWALFLAFAGVGIAKMIAKKVLLGGI